MSACCAHKQRAVALALVTVKEEQCFLNNYVCGLCVEKENLNLKFLNK